MANPLRNAMVYLGLAEEEQEYAADERAQSHAREARHAAPAPAPRKLTERAPQHEAEVTPLRRSAPTRVAAPAPTAYPASDMNEIVTVHPREYKDAQVIAEQFRDGVPIIINLSQMTEGDARRLIDFASGLAMGLFGKIERVTGKVFLLSPSHVAVTGDPAAAEGEIDASF